MDGERKMKRRRMDGWIAGRGKEDEMKWWQDGWMEGRKGKCR